MLHVIIRKLSVGERFVITWLEVELTVYVTVKPGMYVNSKYAQSITMHSTARAKMTTYTP